MKISSKGKYALASMVILADNYSNDEPVAVINVSNILGVSKIYLEQVFSLLKRAELVTSSKGALGGYRLAKPAKEISVFDILLAVETSVFDKPSKSLGEDATHIEDAMESLIWEIADIKIRDIFNTISLEKLMNESNKNKGGNDYMFFI